VAVTGRVRAEGCCFGKVRVEVGVCRVVFVLRLRRFRRLVSTLSIIISEMIRNSCKDDSHNTETHRSKYWDVRSHILVIWSEFRITSDNEGFGVPAIAAGPQQ